MSAWTCRATAGKAAQKILPPRPRIPWKDPGVDSEEKHEPVSDIDIAVVDSLKALDPKRPIREADIVTTDRHAGRDSCTAANGDRRIVASGWAVAYKRYPLDYVADEDAARRSIWSGDLDMPWDWRAQR
jgi:hypothetical protein